MGVAGAPQSLKQVSCQGQERDDDDGDAPHHRRRQPCDVRLARPRPNGKQELAATATIEYYFFLLQQLRGVLDPESPTPSTAHDK